MGNFTFIDTGIKDLYIVEAKRFGDARGYFMETYNEKDFHEAGLDMRFVQSNESRSCRGVLRGLHFQKKYPQGKLVRVTKGEVFDVAVDLRRNSSTFGQWRGVYLSEENKRQFYVPEGFAHGFYVTSEVAEFVYQVTNLYHPEDEGALFWNDPQVGVEWPLIDGIDVLLSEKDQKNPLLKDIDWVF
ncbi:MAG: dTDP-4-dehydrorhamnose 3,5-epimerase [Lachnospiraceae bacterium]|jgi:dTDP-4-dehydrorhamnose 3,5-epimerase|nr:dTDP-4-dehydrorhamnose 3,5-epimerase [Lachnospiraceae bacterium]